MEKTDDLIAGAKNGEAVFEMLQIDATLLLQAANIMAQVSAVQRIDHKEVFKKQMSDNINLEMWVLYVKMGEFRFDNSGTPVNFLR